MTDYLGSASNYHDGSQLWLRYLPVRDAEMLEQYRAVVTGIVVQNCGANKAFRANPDLSASMITESLVESTLEAARNELLRGLRGLLDAEIPELVDVRHGAVVAGTPESSPLIAGLNLDAQLADVGGEGFIIKTARISGCNVTVIVGSTDIGVLYGTFRFLRLIQTHKSVANLDIADKPKFNNRQLNNWEMGDMRHGRFLKWTGENALPTILDSYIIFARTAASVGVNQLSVNMINADDAFLGQERLTQVSALADALRPYGVKLLLSINYTAPSSANPALDAAMRVAGNNDPYSRDYQDWWTYKTIQITELIPDFVGYTVKANSEGMPGPQQYGYTHADGANGIAKAIAYKGRFAFRGFERDKVDLNAKVFWRTFVYEAKVDPDRLKRPYLEFGHVNDDVLRGAYVRDTDGDFVDTAGNKLYSGDTPSGVTNTDAGCHMDADGNPMRDGDFRHRPPILDADGDTIQGGFLPNAYIQTKNGPLDFQPVEPVHPLFGLMDNTTQMFEVQVYQEYTGGTIFPCFLAPMWERALKWETNAEAYKKDAKGRYILGVDGKRIVEKKNALVGEIVEGSFQGQRDSGMVGVCNLDGSPSLCTSQPMAQANWFAFGRQSWDWTVTSDEIADDWARMTWGNDATVVETVKSIMLGTIPAVIAYENPLGLHHQFNLDTHYTAYPWEDRTQDDWDAVYYAKADSAGIGYNRTSAGANMYVPVSGYTEQYFEPLRSVLSDIDTCPEELITWFHHVPWNRVMKSGRTFWDELVYRYQMGVQAVTWMRDRWDSLREHMISAGDGSRWETVRASLETSERDAARWRDVMIWYLRQFSETAVPVNDAPLSVSVTAGGRVHTDFDLSVDAFAHTNVLGPSMGGNGQSGEPGFEVAKYYTLRIPVGAEPVITAVTPLTGASCVIVKQAADMSDEAVVRVENTHEVVGNLAKYYRFRFAYDTVADSETVENAAETVRGSYDDFTFGTLDSAWSWLREDAAHWDINAGTGLTIRAQSGDMSGGANGARNVLLRGISGGSWVAETKLSISKVLDTNYEQAGIVAYLDDGNYVKVAWMHQNSGFGINARNRRFVMSWAVNGETTFSAPGGTLENASFFTLTALSNYIKADDFIWLRLVKDGSRYRSYFSLDGSAWRWIGQHSAEWKIDLDPARIGLFAYAGTAPATGSTGNAGICKGDLDVTFEYFSVEAV